MARVLSEVLPATAAEVEHEDDPQGEA
jgi:hypothetical protein